MGGDRKCPYCDTRIVLLDGEPDCLCGRCAEEACGFCGEPASHRETYTGQPMCDECARPREDGPLGGMGFGIDYSEQLAAAKGLK